jgi:hypothetical protein
MMFQDFKKIFTNTRKLTTNRLKLKDYELRDFCKNTEGVINLVIRYLVI